MHRASAVTALALGTIAMAVGGAIVRILAMGGAPAPLATLGGTAVLVIAGLRWGAEGRGRTPYWP